MVVPALALKSATLAASSFSTWWNILSSTEPLAPLHVDDPVEVAVDVRVRPHSLRLLHTNICLRHITSSYVKKVLGLNNACNH